MATGIKMLGKCQWLILEGPISVACVCGCPLAGIAGSVPAGGVGGYYECCVCCQVEVCAMGQSLVQRSSTECGVSECHHEASIMRRPWPTRGCCTMENKDWRGVILVYHWARRCVIITVSGVCLYAHISSFNGSLLDVTVDSTVLGRYVRTEN